MNTTSRDFQNEIEHDAFVENMVRGWDFVLRNRWVVIGSVAVLVVAIGAGFAVMQSKRLAEARASVFVNRATETIQNGSPAEALPLLERAVAEYGGTKAARDAKYFIGTIALQEDRVADAKEAFEGFLDAHPGQSFLTAAAEGGLAVCAEREGDWTKAAETWTRAALVDESVNFNAAQYLLSAALCWEKAGRADEAVPLLERLIEKFPDSPRKARAEVVLARVRAMS